ncbi:TonB-dependent receptor [Polaribacter porphyrae]|uniref:Oxidoreductase n=1 Tax=Polaribacter porphyrae TaxID=1137780 RepID=A0A2S7WKQ5_9FLAO|nr:TonB-dependent receptor [Polaribacter porphyrae]PQJ78169.1 oxidoreductase [Polaribacter porphyrae]
MHKLFIFCALLMCSYTSNAQNCKLTFKGKIIDFHDKKPLVGASIHILNSNTYSTSNLQGLFEFKNLCKGSYELEFKHISCKTKRVVINVNKNNFKEFYLEHHLEELSEVVVKANTKTENTSIEKTLKQKVIDNFSDKSLGDALNTISGVSSLNTGNSIVKPMIHGLHSSRLLIINNNVRQFDQEWGAEHAPTIDINAFSRIDIVKGANTLIYGSDAIGGLILVRPENYAIKDSLFGSTSTSLNTNGLGGNINTQLIKTYKSGYYTKFQANYKMFGDFEAADYNLSNSGIKSINASARFGFKSFEKGFDAYYSYVNNTIGIIRAAHVGNVNDLLRAINSGEPSFIDDFSYTIDNPRQTISHHLGKIEAYKRFKGLGKITLQYDFQLNRRKEFDRRRAAFENTPAADFRLFTTSLQPNLKIDAFENLVINSGVLIRYQQNDSADESITRISIPLIPDYDKYDTGIYTTVDYKVNSSTELSAGFRYDFSRIEATKKYKVFDWEEENYDTLFPEFSTGVIDNFEIFTTPNFNFHNFSGSLGYKKDFKKNYAFLFNYGLASRMPNVSELFSNGLHHSAARFETGSLTLNKEVANNFIVSFERNSENFGFSISPYYKYINDFIQLIPNGAAQTTIRGAFIEWKYFQVNAEIFGVDIDANKKLSNRFSYRGNISLLQGDNLTDDIPLIHMPSTTFSNTIAYKNKSLNNLTISLTQYSQLRQNRFPDYNFFTFNPILQQDVFVDISSPTDAFTLFHFNSSADFKISKNSNLNIAFAIENMFNVAYRNYLNRLRYFADDVGRNFTIKLKFNY